MCGVHSIPGERLMPMNESRHPGHRLFSLHLSLVARIALGTAVLAVSALLLMLLVVVDQNGATYAELVRAQRITQQNLGPAFLVAGLFVASATGIITWLICLYSSFRVAGPLFRFTRNLELASDTVELPSIRNEDCLHELSEQLQDSVRQLHAHYDEIEQLSDQALALIEREGETSRSELGFILKQLRERDERVRLEG